MIVILIMNPDRNPVHPQKLLDWSLARNTPLFKTFHANIRAMRIIPKI